MPGGTRQIPARPICLRTSQSDCLEYRSGGVGRTLGGLLIGLVFVASGGLGFASITASFVSSDQSVFLNRCIGLLGSTLFMGVGFFCGTSVSAQRRKSRLIASEESSRSNPAYCVFAASPMRRSATFPKSRCFGVARTRQPIAKKKLCLMSP